MSGNTVVAAFDVGKTRDRLLLYRRRRRHYGRRHRRELVSDSNARGVLYSERHNTGRTGFKRDAADDRGGCLAFWRNTIAVLEYAEFRLGFTFDTHATADPSEYNRRVRFQV